MFSNAYLLTFAIAFMGCVLATPLVTRFAIWAGAIDRPDQMRRIHKTATPRLGGLGLAFGLGLCVLVVTGGGYLRDRPELNDWLAKQGSVVLASLIILAVGAIDDVKGMRPRVKLLGQAAAVVVLFLGGVQIRSISFLDWTLDLSRPGLAIPFGGQAHEFGLLSFLATLVWFLGCMNVWNLIDGMDGLASGVGLLVSGTLMLVAIFQNNLGAAIMAAGLAGSLAGFLLYNWHPACIFLGDSGSLLIGLLLGLIGVQGSLKGATGVSILFPILAMGLPISDTAMAIFRRWVRHLPLSAADRRHVHHLLIGLGLSPRQAAFYLYCFSAFLCGVVLLGVALNNEILALIVGLSGCLAFLLILTSRRDELKVLRADLVARLTRGRQERFAAKTTWDAIQRIELCDRPERIWEVLWEACQALGCDSVELACFRAGRSILRRNGGAPAPERGEPLVSGPTATFRLSSGQDLLLIVSLHQAETAELAADIAFRFLQRLSLATAERLERLLASGHPLGQATAPSDEGAGVGQGPVAGPEVVAPLSEPAAHPAPVLTMVPPAAATRDWLSWLRIAFGWET